MVLPSLRYIRNIILQIFTLGRKKAQTKANTVIEKSKEVRMDSKFIHWATLVLWVAFLYCHSDQMAWEHLLGNEIFLGKKAKSYNNVQTVKASAK